MCMPVVYRTHKMVMDTLELELQMMVSCYVDDGNQTPILWKNSQCLTTEP